MIVEEDFEVLGGFAEVFGGSEVVFAGGGVSAGVVVDEDDGGGSVAYGGAEDFPRVDEGGVGGAGGDGLHADELVAGVETEDTDFLDVVGPCFGVEVLEDDFGVVEGGVLGGVGSGEALDDFYVEGELEGFYAPEAGDLSEVFAVPAEYAGEGTGAGEEGVGDGEDVHLGGAGAYEEGEDFAVGEGLGAVTFEALLGAFVRGEVSEPEMDGGRGRGFCVRSGRGLLGNFHGVGRGCRGGCF